MPTQAQPDFAQPLSNVTQAVNSTSEVSAVKNIKVGTSAVTTSPRSTLILSAGASVSIVGSEDSTTDTVTTTFSVISPGITGIIPAAGTTATAGTGFTYTHTNGTGLYVVTFSSAFAATPVVIGSVLIAGGAGTAWAITFTSVSASGFTANMTGAGAGFADAAWNFLAYTVT